MQGRYKKGVASFVQYGKVKEYSIERGFGFLEDEMNNEIFVHVTGLALEEGEQLLEGQAVTYEIAVGAKGPQAIHVKIQKDEIPKKEKEDKII